MEPDDFALMDGVRNDREGAFETLVGRYQRRLYRLACGYLRNHDALTIVHRFAIIPVAEVRSALVHAGLDPVDLYTNWASTAPGEPEGPRVVAVGRPGV